jgi:hypothetical protein
MPIILRPFAIPKRAVRTSIHAATATAGPNHPELIIIIIVKAGLSSAPEHCFLAYDVK